MTIEEFIEARIAEDQENAACDGVEEDGHGMCYYWSERRERDAAAMLAIVGEHHVYWTSRACPYCGGADSDLLGCAGAHAGDWACSTCSYQYIEGEFGQPGPTAGGCRTLRGLASTWRDHEDYDKGWTL